MNAYVLRNGAWLYFAGEDENGLVWAFAASDACHFTTFEHAEEVADTVLFGEAEIVPLTQELLWESDGLA